MVTGLSTKGSGAQYVVVVITPPLPRDEGTARTAIQVHAVNLIEIRLGERWGISQHCIAALLGSGASVFINCKGTRFLGDNYHIIII